MSINLYKSREDYTLIDCKRYLEAKEYEKIDQKRHHSTTFILFLKDKPHDPTDWKILLSNNFDTSTYPSLIEPNFDTRAILLIKHYKYIYILSYGLAFHDISEIIDLDFGLSFAEKSLTEASIKTKNVDFFQDNKQKTITSYKSKSSATIGATESFSNVIGSPEYNRFGDNIQCGNGVKFQNKLIGNDFFKNISGLCIDISDSFNIKKKVTLPRLERIMANSELGNELNEELKNKFITNNVNDIDVKEILDFGNSIHFMSDYSCKIGIENSGLNSVPLPSFSIESIQSYISTMHTNGHNFELDDVYIRATNDNKLGWIRKQLNYFIYCDLSYKKKHYVLQYGLWGEYNLKYLEILNATLDEIPVEVTHQRTKMYNSKTENTYIDNYIKNTSENAQKIHLKFMQPKTVKHIKKIGIELGDIYVEKNGIGEVMAVKQGGNVKDAIYSIEQSLLSLRIMNNLDEFEITDKLQTILPDKNKIKEIKKTTISWIFLTNSQNKEIHKGDKIKIEKILSNEISLKKHFNSLYLKNKLAEWYLICQESSKEAKIVFELPIVYKIPISFCSRPKNSKLILKKIYPK